MPQHDTWSWTGASVRGPAHVMQDSPNQDAWAVARVRDSLVAVVCDGLGSRANSHVGAREACRSVIAASRLWLAQPDLPVELLLRTIHDLWAMRTHAVGAAQCATTCLLAITGHDGGVTAAQLGDGLIASICETVESATTLGDREDGFGNQTTGLGVATSLSEWRWKKIESPAPRAVLLATDGIADDLRPEKTADFVRHVRDQHSSMPRNQSQRHLRKDLDDWPVPKHGDDKTLVLLWRHSA
jgi:serine/threonine protein phosphatase PrpC